MLILNSKSEILAWHGFKMHILTMRLHSNAAIFFSYRYSLLTECKTFRLKANQNCTTVKNILFILFVMIVPMLIASRIMLKYNI